MGTVVNMGKELGKDLSEIVNTIIVRPAPKIPGFARKLAISLALLAPYTVAGSLSPDLKERIQSAIPRFNSQLATKLSYVGNPILYGASAGFGAYRSGNDEIQIATLTGVTFVFGVIESGIRHSMDEKETENFSPSVPGKVVSIIPDYVISLRKRAKNL